MCFFDDSVSWWMKAIHCAKTTVVCVPHPIELFWLFNTICLVCCAITAIFVMTGPVIMLNSARLKFFLKLSKICHHHCHFKNAINLHFNLLLTHKCCCFYCFDSVLYVFSFKFTTNKGESVLQTISLLVFWILCISNQRSTVYKIGMKWW